VLIGLTGGYCAGKNAVADLLEGRGWACVDVDRLGHEALALSKEAVVARFGPSVLAPDGSLDRRALGALVFADPRALADHEAIVHPAMFALLDRRVAELRSGGGAGADIVINAAVLYKMPILAACEAVIEVRAPLVARLGRARRRDRLGARAALGRILRQGALWRLRGRAEGRIHLLHNDGDLGALEGGLSRLLARLGR